MLVDVQVRVTDQISNMIAEINGNSAVTTKLVTGVYKVGHFNFEHDLEANGYEVVEFWKDDFQKGVDYDDMVWMYGVCDSHEQILARWGDVLHGPDYKFVISMTPVLKENQEPHGGWRWHKWGPYIGTHTITTEYLYDEPEIDGVFAYHIHRLV